MYILTYEKSCKMKKNIYQQLRSKARTRASQYLRQLHPNFTHAVVLVPKKNPVSGFRERCCLARGIRPGSTRRSRRAGHGNEIAFRGTVGRGAWREHVAPGMYVLEGEKSNRHSESSLAPLRN